jgi:hypothetical protein
MPILMPLGSKVCLYKMLYSAGGHAALVAQCSLFHTDDFIVFYGVNE